MAALRAQYQKIDNEKCTSWGAKPGSDGYLNCMMTLNTNRQNALATVAAADARAAGEENAARSAALIQAGQRMMTPPPPTVVVQAPPPLQPLPTPLHCTSTGMGNTVSTNCY